MKVPKIILIILCLCIISLIGYIIFLKKNSQNTIITTTSAVEVMKGTLIDSIHVTGNAALANEQKLKFGQTGKISEIFVKVGDNVEEGDILASLDKRNFFQEMAQAQNELDKINKNIADEKEKIHGPETRQLERQIASMERKLEEMKEDLSKTVQTSPEKNQEKILNLNEKKRELEIMKDKYALDLANYEKEEKNQKELIDAKIIEGTRLIKNIIQNTYSEGEDMKQIHRGINKIFGFDMSDLNWNERDIIFYIGNADKGRREEVQYLWKETRNYIDGFVRISLDIPRDSEKNQDAKGIIDESIRVYKKILEMTDAALASAQASQVYSDSSFTQDELDKVLSEIKSFRNTVQSKISSLQESKENLLILDSPEKITEKFLFDLKNKKIALEKQKDDIKRAEIQISQEEKDLHFIADGRIENTSLKREIAEKQSAIQDQEDAILTKKEELLKIQSGKSDVLENLLSSRKNQLSEMEKLKTREESFEIRAPFSGTIRAIKMQVGDVLGGNSSVSEEEKSILLENSEIINIKVALNQLDIIKVSLGQVANISFEAVPGAILEGKIVEISSTPSTQGGDFGGEMSSYEVIIAAERGEYAIYSGMNAMIDIPLESSEEVLLIPTTAVNEDSKTFEKYVNIIEPNGDIVKTFVETGRTNKSQIEIISGISEGQKVQIIDFNTNSFTSDDFSSNYGYY